MGPRAPTCAKTVSNTVPPVYFTMPWEWLSGPRDRNGARGAVFVEKLIVYAPLMLLFFMGFQLAEMSAAELVVRRAASAAARAAIVVLPDDPAYYDGEAVHLYEGHRRDDIQLAAAMVLSAAPQLDGDFAVTVGPPPSPPAFGTLDVTVDAIFHCGIPLMCGMDRTQKLSATIQHAYHHAEYEYDVLSSPVGGTTESLSNGTPAIGTTVQAVVNAGKKTSPDPCNCVSVHAVRC